MSLKFNVSEKGINDLFLEGGGGELHNDTVHKIKKKILFSLSFFQKVAAVTLYKPLIQSIFQNN